MTNDEFLDMINDRKFPDDFLGVFYEYITYNFHKQMFNVVNSIVYNKGDAIDVITDTIFYLHNYILENSDTFFDSIRKFQGLLMLALRRRSLNKVDSLSRLLSRFYNPFDEKKHCIKNDSISYETMRALECLEPIERTILDFLYEGKSKEYIIREFQKENPDFTRYKLNKRIQNIALKLKTTLDLKV